MNLPKQTKYFRADQIKDECLSDSTGQALTLYVGVRPGLITLDGRFVSPIRSVGYLEGPANQDDLNSVVQHILEGNPVERIYEGVSAISINDFAALHEGIAPSLEQLDDYFLKE